MYVLDTVFKDLQSLMKTFTIKYEKKAKKFETLEITKASDKYMSAIQMEDSFHTYQSFNKQAFENAGINDDTLIDLYMKNKFLIPNDKRLRIVDEQRKFIINTYEEKNNYYRMLIGLPDIEDTDFIYLDEAVVELLEIDPMTPIHKLTKDEVSIIENRGILTKIIAENPTKYYLKYLGNKQINLARARTTKNFGILYITTDMSESFFDEFNNIYEQCREYFMTVIYNKDFGNRYDLYDNFIGMMIMIMAVQRIIVNTFKYGIERDFYDLGSVQMLFDSYNVPFIENLPMEYQRILVRNLNNLLRYKSTDKVLYDICSLLGFERIKIFKYFLIKEHRLNNEGNPLFVYKEEENPDGTTSLVEDVEQMYNLYFQTVELRDRNRALALTDSLSRLDYNQVVVDDPYWWDDDAELNKRLYESEYNYVETKYLNMNIMYKLTEMLFEVIFVFRLLLEKKDEIGEITIELPKMFNTKKIALFDSVALLCALISRQNGMAGNIISTPTKTLSVMGFNFKADFAAIRKDLQKNSHLYDPRIISLISDLRVDSVEDINRLFKNIKDLNELIVKTLGATQDRRVYEAYRKLHTMLMVTDHTEALFKKSDGEIAQTFLEYLEDRDTVLSDFVSLSDKSKMTEYIEHIIYNINSSLTQLQYLYILNDSNNVLLNAAITLIRFFKSYTTDLSAFNILYLMDSRYWNSIKLMHDVKTVSKRLGYVENGVIKIYGSNIRRVTSTHHQKEKLRLMRNDAHDSIIKVKLKDKKRNVMKKDRLKIIRG